MDVSEYNKNYYLNRFKNPDWKGKGNVSTCPECSIEYVMTRSDQLYCSVVCRNKHAQRENGHRYSIKKLYGLEKEDYDLMEASQDGLCAICHKPQESNKSDKLYVDHNHTSGKVRELLCSKCNALLGMCDENVELLRAAAVYLEKHEGDSNAID